MLFFGIFGSLVLRLVFIGLGAALMQFHWVVRLFAGSPVSPPGENVVDQLGEHRRKQSEINETAGQ